MSYIGTQPIEKASRTLTQGTFGADAQFIAVPQGYTPGNILLYINGLLWKTTDYDAVNGSVVDLKGVYPAGTDYVVEEVRNFLLPDLRANMSSYDNTASGLTANNVKDAIDESYSITAHKATTHNFTTDADYTLTATQETFGRLIFTDTTPVLTAARSVIVSTDERPYVIQNDTSQVLTVKTSAGTGVAVAAGADVQVQCDGTNVVEVGRDFGAMPLVAGDPIVEEGSNANGSYVRFASGFQICTRKKTFASRTVSTSSYSILVNNDASQLLYPADFVGSPYTGSTYVGGYAGEIVATHEGSSVTEWGNFLFLVKLTGADQTIIPDVRLSAIGWWK